MAGMMKGLKATMKITTGGRLFKNSPATAQDPAYAPPSPSTSPTTSSPASLTSDLGAQSPSSTHGTAATTPELDFAPLPPFPDFYALTETQTAPRPEKRRAADDSADDAPTFKRRKTAVPSAAPVCALPPRLVRPSRGARSPVTHVLHQGDPVRRRMDGWRKRGLPCAAAVYGARADELSCRDGAAPAHGDSVINISPGEVSLTFKMAPIPHATAPAATAPLSGMEEDETAERAPMPDCGDLRMEVTDIDDLAGLCVSPTAPPLLERVGPECFGVTVEMLLDNLRSLRARFEDLVVEHEQLKEITMNDDGSLRHASPKSLGKRKEGKGKGRCQEKLAASTSSQAQREGIKHCLTCFCDNSGPEEYSLESDTAAPAGPVLDPQVASLLASALQADNASMASGQQLDPAMHTVATCSPPEVWSTASQPAVDCVWVAANEEAPVYEEEMHEEGGMGVGETMHDQAPQDHEALLDEQVMSEAALVPEKPAVFEGEVTREERTIGGGEEEYEEEPVQLTDPVLDSQMQLELAIAGISLGAPEDGADPYFYSEVTGALDGAATSFEDIHHASASPDFLHDGFDVAQALLDLGSQPMPRPSSPGMSGQPDEFRPEAPSTAPHTPPQGPRKIKALPRNSRFPGRAPPVVGEEEAPGFQQELERQVYIARFSAPPEFAYREAETLQLRDEPVQPVVESGLDDEDFAAELEDALAASNTARDPFSGERRPVHKQSRRPGARHRRS
ncbi:hypothetical protein HWV62_32912 [Athelia sp. TMB]|nr:hypothetical protein HWV62_32912 [Athelia sp. TMB]